MKKYLSAITIFLFGIYIVKLALTGTLQLYITVNNIWYTVVAGVICCGIGALGIFLESNNKADKVTGGNKIKVTALLLSVPLVFAVFTGIILPAEPIVYNASNFVPIIPPAYETNKDVNDEVIERLIGFNTQQYTFAEWYLTESLSPDFHFQSGKPVDLTGQVFTINQTNHTLYFGRLYITCCVIDARPFVFKVPYLTLQGESSLYQPNEWLRIQGSLSPEMINGKRELSIIPYSIQVVVEPTEPYVN